MNKEILKCIDSFSSDQISVERKEILNPLVEYIKNKKTKGEIIRLNFICTHNSRRSHLAQIWAQTMSYHFGIQNVFCYSGGTEATAIFPKVIETLEIQGFNIQKLSDGENPVFAIKYCENEAPIICFSKIYNDDFNPRNNFGAVMTCSDADEACPLVIGAEARFKVKYDDPKVFDTSDLQNIKYIESSLDIANEMFYVFSNVKFDLRIG
jgi:arsenate reductase